MPNRIAAGLAFVLSLSLAGPARAAAPEVPAAPPVDAYAPQPSVSKASIIG